MALLYDIILFQFLGLITVKICKFLSNKFLDIDKIFDFFLRAGHLIRELIHFIVSRILFVPKEWSDYNDNNKSGWGDIDYELTPEYIERTSFLKEVLIATAPLWIGTYLSYKMIELYKIYDPIGFKILIVIGMIIILCFSVIKFSDYKNIFRVLFEKPFTFIKQLIFLGASYLIYIYNFDYFYDMIPHYHYLYEYLLLLSLEGIIELSLIVIGFIIKKIVSPSRNDSMITRRAYRKWRRESIKQNFPNKRKRKKEKARMDDLYSGFSLLPHDDETAAEEFQEAMIRENKLMIDIKKKGIER